MIHELKEVISNGIKCPICNKGFIEMIPTTFYHELCCDSCYKKLEIQYKEKPFEIINIRELIFPRKETITNIKNGKGDVIMTIKDSGETRDFGTGAIRDASEGKGRCDLLPAAALLRLAKHYEAGANKYGDRNWEKGQPMSVLLDSGMRHLFKYMDGWTDEDHLAAAAWNILGAMQMEAKHPELQNIPSRRTNND